MTRPMTLTSRPGRMALIPRFIASSVRSTRSLTSSLTSPARNVALVSPWTPWMNAVTSTLTMSPSRITVVSGIPWQITSLSETQLDLGNDLYPRVDG